MDVFLFDSGSDITPKQQPHFDKIFPNIYYNGLLNKTHRFLQENGYDVGMIITSDVEIDDVDMFIKKMKSAFENEEVGVYAPSTSYSHHRHMIHKSGKKLTQVSFTEGFCFAVRSEILAALCPIDVALNKYGYGSDIILGYHTLNQNKISVVDHNIVVEHPYGSGYDKHKAVAAKHRWLGSLPKRQHWFYKIAEKSFLKNSFGTWLTDLLFRSKR